MTHYEAHLTIFGPDNIPARELARFVQAAKEIGGKPLVIELLGGKKDPVELAHPLQIMVGRKVELLDDEEAAEWMKSLSGRLMRRGLKVERAKLEAEIGPGTALYYESHWVLKPGTINFSPSYLISRSLFSDKLYATSRVKPSVSDMPWLIARDKFSLSQHQLKDVLVKGDHFERVIVDTNPGLDDGWA